MKRNKCICSATVHTPDTCDDCGCPRCWDTWKDHVHEHTTAENCWHCRTCPDCLHLAMKDWDKREEVES